MPVIEDTRVRLSDLLKRELDPLYCRDGVLVAAGQRLAIGTVLGRVTATGRAVPVATGATDGSERPIGVLAVNVDTTDGEERAWVIARASVVALDSLVFGSGVAPADQPALVEALIDRGIVVRDAV